MGILLVASDRERKAEEEAAHDKHIEDDHPMEMATIIIIKITKGPRATGLKIYLEFRL